MTPPVEAGIPVYGLTSNPFRLETLDPLFHPTDLDCLSLVDGWKDLTEAEELIGRRVAEEKPVFFVVEGASDTGRSSVANYLVYLWAKERGVGRDSVLVHPPHPRDSGGNRGTYAPEDQVLGWISSLRVRNVVERLGLTEPTQKQLSGLPQAASPTAATDYSLALYNTERDLRTPADGGRELLLAAILERGKGRGLVPLIRESFQATRAIVVITVDSSVDSQDVLADISRLLPSDQGLVLSLGPIQGADVGTIIENRWDCYRKGIENPFDLTAVAEVFTSPRPIARVVKALGWMLEVRQAEFSDEEPWPATKRLAFKADQMHRLLSSLDRNLYLGK